MLITGLMFNIMQYLPVRDEHNCKTEYFKKSVENEGNSQNETESNSENSDNDNENETNSLINSHLNLKINQLSNTIHHSYHSELNYQCSLNNIITPPPEA